MLYYPTFYEGLEQSKNVIYTGQEATQPMDVDFPAEALRAKRVKEIRLDLVYIPVPYRDETVRLNVTIGGP